MVIKVSDNPIETIQSKVEKNFVSSTGIRGNKTEEQTEKADLHTINEHVCFLLHNS